MLKIILIKKIKIMRRNVHEHIIYSLSMHLYISFLKRKQIVNYE